MSKAVASHIWLLLTLRHPMTGLPQTFAPWSALIVVSGVVAWVRWGEPAAFAYMLVACGAMSILSPRASAAYALLSIGIDAVAMLAEPVAAARWDDVFAGWELLGAAAIGRCLLKSA